MRIETDVAGLVELVSNVNEAYTTALFIADNQRKLLKLWHFYSLGDNVIPDATIPFGVGPIGWVAENRQEFDISKFFERDTSLLKLYSRNENIKSFYALPIINHDGTLEGVLSIDSKNRFVFSNKQQKLIRLLADQIVNLINNLKVEKFVNTEMSDVAFMHRFCREIASVANVDSILRLTLRSLIRLVKCELYTISLQTDNIESGEFCIEVAYGNRNLRGLVFSDQDGLAGCVIKGREPFLLTNRREGAFIFAPMESLGRVRSFLGVPLSFRYSVSGLICLMDGKEENFSQRDLQLVSIIADNISLAIANAKTQERIQNLLTNTDGLTGLYNFIGFQEHLDEVFQVMNPKRRVLSLLMMDLDNFGNINTIFGYEIGNEVLRQFAKLLIDISMNNNIVAARYGPDEFALTLPNITRDEAFEVAGEICRTVQDPTFIMPSSGVRASVSAGISSFPVDSINKDQLLENALYALSLAKSRGGGRASFCSDRIS